MFETYRDVHVDRPLTNLSVAHFQNTAEFVAHRFFPVVPVRFASDSFDYYPSGYFNKIHDTKRGEESKANSISYAVTSKNYSCGEDALRTFISDRKRANVDSQRRLDQEAAILVTNALLLKKEKNFVDTFMAENVWTTNFKGKASAPSSGEFIKWSDAASDPVKDVSMARIEMIRVGKRRPTRGIMTLDVYETLRNHPDILDRIKYTGTSTSPAMASVRALAELFELQEILIMQTVVNMAADKIEDNSGNPTVNDTFLATGKFLLGYVEGGAGLMAPVAGATFVHNRYIGLGMNGGPAIRRYRENPAIKGEYIEGEMSIDQRVIAPDLGCLMLDCV